MVTWRVADPQRLSVEEPVQRLDIALISATVNVVGTDGPARVEVTKVSGEPLVVEHDGGVLRVRHEDPPRFPGLLWWVIGRRYEAKISVAVPYETLSEMRVTSGSVVASGLRAGAVVQVTRGRITMLGLGGRVSAKVISGSVEALGVGGELTTEVTSGDVTVADSAASRVYARVVSGTLTCDLDNPHGSDIRLETTSGEITVRVREDSDLDVHLQAASGRVSSNFGQLGALGMAGMRSAHGRLGAGTGRLYATALSGNISLLARPVDGEGAV